jgi:hypothetical protein
MGWLLLVAGIAVGIIGVDRIPFWDRYVELELLPSWWIPLALGVSGLLLIWASRLDPE